MTNGNENDIPQGDAKIRAYWFGGPDQEASRTQARTFFQSVNDNRLGWFMSTERYESHSGYDAYWFVVQCYDTSAVDRAYDAATS